MNKESIKPPSLRSEAPSSLPKEGQDYIHFLEKQLVSFMAQAQLHAAKIQELEARLNKNSSNSGKPPSSACQDCNKTY